MTKTASVLLLAVCLSAGQRHAPTIDDSLNVQVSSNPRISPEGARVVYQVSRTNWKENTFDGDLWLADVGAPHNPRNLKVGPAWNGDPRWSPDGQLIAFVSDRSGRRQIFVVPVAGGEAAKLTRAESGVTEFAWSPDGKSIYFTADDDPVDHPDRSEQYGDFEVVQEERPTATLWRIGLNAAPGASPDCVIDGKKHSVSTFAPSPDGTRIAFQADGIFVFDPKTRSVNAVAQGAGPYRNPVWSPDGSAIAFETAGGSSGFYYSNWYIATVPAAGGEVTPVTNAFDEDADLIAWNSSGIYFSALQKTASLLFLADPKSLAIHRVTGSPRAVDQQFSIAADTAALTFVRNDSGSPPEIYAAANGSEARLTENSAQIAGFDLARRETIAWKSAGGAEIEGILYKPADFDPSKRYPLLVAIHGGPVASDLPTVRPDRYYPVEQFVARGALVLRPNYRGSAGYGAKFRALPVGNLGAGDAADIESGVDYLVGKGWVDPDRVGAMGWSEGGYIAAYLATTSNRFAAVSVGAGISDWTAYYSGTDILPFTRQYLKATPWSDPEAYRKASPVAYVNKANTPVLIQHGDEDRRVPISNAYELRLALEDRKVPVRMVVYKGMGHSIDRPKQQRAVMEHNLEWFDQWVFRTGKRLVSPVTVSQSQIRTSGDSQ